MPPRLLTWALLLPLALASCERFDREPREVAEAFWVALYRGELAEARALTREANESELRELAELHDVSGIRFGEILHGEETALVASFAVLSPGEVELSFHTHLVRTPEGWRVDATESRRALTRAALAYALERVSEQVRAGADRVVEELETRALEVSELLRGSLEELTGALGGEPGAHHPASAEPNGCRRSDAVDARGRAVVEIRFGGETGYNYEPRCVRADTGARLRFSGPFAAHPLRPGEVDDAHGGAGTGGPIAAQGSGERADFELVEPGTFGFFCDVHAHEGMSGAVFVETP